VDDPVRDPYHASLAKEDLNEAFSRQ